MNERIHRLLVETAIDAVETRADNKTRGVPVAGKKCKLFSFYATCAVLNVVLLLFR